MLLLIKDLSKSFEGVQALEKVSFELQEGEAVGVLGPNGSGKTTLQACIAGTIRPDSGRVLLREKSLLDEPPENRIKFGITRMFQMPQLIPSLSVAANIAMGLYHSITWWNRFGLPNSGEHVNTALSKVGLVSKAETFASQLSFFEKRKTELARALVGRLPCLILLDEPTSGLTGEERSEFEELLKKIKSDGIGLLLVEHEWELVEHICERVLIMQSGRIITDRQTIGLRVDPAVRRVFWGDSPNVVDT